MNDIKFFDSTLRDGSHAIAHTLLPEQVARYCRAVDGSGVHVVIVGHGNGLGASSLQVGLSAAPDAELLNAARENLKHTKLGVLIFPGFGTIDDDLKPALALGTDLILVAAHCTEADLTAQYISYAKAQRKEVYGMLMMYHMTTKDRLLAEAKKMEGCGAQGILLMDSAGASTPALVKETVTHLVGNLSIPVGFHAHNNLGMAVAHTWLALEAGAKIVDGTVKGFGAGAGNCALEVLTALLQKMGYKTPTDLYKLMDAGGELERSIMKKPQEISSLSIASALAGVFSGFARQAKRAAETYGVDARDIFKILGERRIIVGQEDMVFEIAMELAKQEQENKKTRKQMNVADFLLKYFSDRGVTHAFLLPGGHAMYLNDALAKNKQLSYTCLLHEQGVVMAAEAYGRTAGRPAIAMVTAGPGATNALTGVVGAWVDSSPMIVITGQSDLNIVRHAEKTGIRQLGAQGVVIRDMATPFTKYFATVDSPAKAGIYAAKAWEAVTTGRPGPVWLEVPLDIQRSEVPAAVMRAAESKSAPHNEKHVTPALVKKTAEVYKRIAKAKRPLFIFGQGVRLANGIPEFEAVIKKIKIPLITSRLGLDIIPSDHPLFIGRPGTYGDRAANLAVQNADLIVAVGSRLATSMTGYNVKDFGRNADIILVDIDEKELKKPDLRVIMPVKADAKAFLAALASEARAYGGIERATWLAIAKGWRKKYPVVLPEYKTQNPVNTYYFVDRLSALAPEGAQILTDTSSIFHVSAQAWKIKKDQRYITTGGISTMGYWVASVGMCIANNRKSTIVLVGDGSLEMNIYGFATVKGSILPIKIFVLNNNGYLLIRHTQKNFFEGRMIGESPASGVTLPDVRKVAEAYGLKTMRINSANEVDQKIKEVLAYDGPVVCEVMTPEWQNIMPRVGGRKTEDGKVVPNAYENMSPPLPPEELKANMVAESEQSSLRAKRSNLT